MVRFDVDHHSHAPWHTAGDSKLAGAHQRNIRQTHRACGLGGEHGVQVVGGREEDTDDIVEVDVIATEHVAQQRSDALDHLLPSAGIEGGGAANRAD